MKVKDCMNKEVVCCTPDSTVSDCAKLMSGNHIGCLPVCDANSKVVGLLTDRDVILRCIACDKEANNTKVKDIMSKDVCCCSSEEEICTAEKQMSENQIRRIPVIENEKIVGIVTLGDLAENKEVDTETVCGCLENICSNNQKNHAD